MGSFRIVTGSGYGRHEITGGRALRREFDLLKKAARNVKRSQPKISSKKTTSHTSSAKLGDLSRLYDKLWDDAVRKANKWARETAAEMRASVPVDTGNLRESIHVLEKECYRNKATGEISMVVGVDLDPSGGRGKLYAPPHRKQSPRYGRKTSPWKGYRIMPSYNPAYPEGYAAKFFGEGGTVLKERFKAIGVKNAKKIMGK